MEIDEIDGNDGHTYHLKKIDEIQEMLTTEREREREINETNLVHNIAES